MRVQRSKGPEVQRSATIVAALVLTSIAVLGFSARALDQAGKADLVTAPRFEVDPMWPKPLPMAG
jgi:hypothetical protein